MQYRKLNINWNAAPNAPRVKVEVIENRLRVEFFLNPYVFEHIKEEDKGELVFKDCYQYSFNGCNDEGYYRGQYRYTNKDLPWGEFYEIETDWEHDFHHEFEIINPNLDKSGLRHFIFFFRDHVIECVAKDFEFKYPTR